MHERQVIYERRAITEGKLIRGDLTRDIIGAAIEAHKELGPGLLESAYDECLCHELNARGLKFHRQLTLPVTYKRTALDCGYLIDFLIEDSFTASLKSAE